MYEPRGPGASLVDTPWSKRTRPLGFASSSSGTRLSQPPMAHQSSASSLVYTGQVNSIPAHSSKTYGNSGAPGSLKVDHGVSHHSPVKKRVKGALMMTLERDSNGNRNGYSNDGCGGSSSSRQPTITIRDTPSPVSVITISDSEDEASAPS